MSMPAFIPRVSAARERRMVRVPEGWFWMGSDSGQDNERPVHRVWIDAFLLAACQVTNAEYARFLHAAGAAPPPHWSNPNFNHPDQPVVAVSWFEAKQYCEWLSAATGKHFRLPTEAEWERAARSGSWRHHITVARCAARSSIPPEFQYADYGFRIACGI